MDYFFDTVETVPEGVGFAHYSATHLFWLGLAVAVWVTVSLLYRKADPRRRQLLRYAVATLLVADEIFKHVMLLIGGRWITDYLPLHLCSFNIFLITYHAFRPGKATDQFLYCVCIPGALAALLFPTWASLPMGNFMHLHSFTVHILLVLYPVMLLAGGDIRREAKLLPRTLLLLAASALLVLPVNLLLGTNFMFLMYAEPGNPLYFFQEAFGSHLLGFPVIIAAIVVVLYFPYQKLLKRKKAEMR